MIVSRHNIFIAKKCCQCGKKCTLYNNSGKFKKTRQPATVNKKNCEKKILCFFRETVRSFDNFVKMGSSGEEIKVAVRVRKLLDRENGSNIQWKTQGQNEIKSIKDPSKK